MPNLNFAELILTKERSTIMSKPRGFTTLEIKIPDVHR